MEELEQIERAWSELLKLIGEIIAKEWIEGCKSASLPKEVGDKRICPAGSELEEIG